MNTTDINTALIDSYFLLLKSLSPNSKLELIERLYILPIFPALDIYVTEKGRLKTRGKILDDFDLLIGSIAIFNNLILVTKNVSDFERLNGIIIEDWTTG